MKENNEENFKQLVVWPGTLVAENQITEFEEFFKTEFNTRIKFDSVQITNPDFDNQNGGGRSDAFFYIHKDDIIKFALPKLNIGARWWEDVFFNHQEYLYSDEFIKNHPNPTTW